LGPTGILLLEVLVKTRIISLLLLVLAGSGLASAQSFNGDARKIAMGGTGYSENIASRMIEDQRPYTAIALPLGLIQIAQDRDRLDPRNKDIFDPVLVMEYAANPIHYTFGRDPGGARGRLVNNLINGNMSRDLNSYRGIELSTNLKSEGLSSPSWGKTFKFRRSQEGAFQGFYVGAGPYFSAMTDLNIDKGLADVLASSTPVAIPNRNFSISDRSAGQLAMAVTGGYRARFNLPGKMASRRDGIYIGVNYNYLYGFRYMDSAISAQLNTGADGLITIMPMTTPLNINYYESNSGKGFALDFGVGAVINKWELGFGANGVANRIDWHDLTLRNYRLQSLVTEADFIEQRLPATPSDLTEKLPIQYTGNVGYHERAYTLIAEVANGFQGTSFRGGAEYKLSRIEFRGGARYGLDRWHPTGGIGIDFCKILSLDFAAFGTTTNLERQLRPSLAVSLRINRIEK
jgi:hypothetical protein